jgi:hypothetical protein
MRHLSEMATIPAMWIHVLLSVSALTILALVEKSNESMQESLLRAGRFFGELESPLGIQSSVLRRNIMIAKQWPT